MQIVEEEKEARDDDSEWERPSRLLDEVVSAQAKARVNSQRTKLIDLSSLIEEDVDEQVAPDTLR